MASMLQFSAFIFDLDGVIVDSEHIHYECYKQSFKQTINYDLEWNDYCKIHHSINTSTQFSSNIQIYNKKTELYKQRIKDVELISGFYEFFNVLLKHGKYICIVTDSSDEILNTLFKKFPFLKKSNIIITRNCVKHRKPNSECYFKLLQQLPPHIVNHEIISFEDSYKGWYAASNAIYNCILVNDKTYVYYDTINALNAIPNFDDILNFNYKIKINYKPFYVSSKTHHRDKWIELRNYFPLVSNWIDINKNKNEMKNEDKEDICHNIKNDISLVDFGIVYLERNEKDHIGSLIEIGLLLANSKQIYICGDNIFKDEVLFNFPKYLNYKYVNQDNLFKLFTNMQYDMSTEYNYFIQKLPTYNPNIQSVAVNENKAIDYIIICASGKGTRLLPITKDIPKLLVNVDNLNILLKITNYWKKYSNKFVIIVDSKYNKIINFYLGLSNVQYEVINVSCCNGEENSYTLNQALNDPKYTNKKVLITWCDIYPESTIPTELFADKNIIFTYKNYGRYDAVCNKIIKKPYGNIIGIYYFSSFTHLNIFKPTMDICDCYAINFGNFTTFEIEQLTDIGDYQKLCQYIYTHNQTYSTRYFNTITDLSNNAIEKRSTCTYGNSIITNEMLFYKYNAFDNMPSILEFGYDYFKMEKISNARSMIEIFNESNVEEQKIIINNILTEINKMHCVEKVEVSKIKWMEDIKVEFYDKVLLRLDNIEPLLSYFNNVKSVNNIRIQYSHTHIIDDIYSRLKTRLLINEPEYTIIHGDPHMSNILLDANNKMWFIDPRGYFGNTKLFGLKEYDIGKLVYSLSGFDHLNNNNNHFFIIDEADNIDTNINNNMPNFLHLFEQYNAQMMIDMTILHWFGLTDYSKTNIHKCISAYYYGIYLYHLYYVST